jgi:hypothetical protein
MLELRIIRYIERRFHIRFVAYHIDEIKVQHKGMIITIHGVGAVHEFEGNVFSYEVAQFVLNYFGQHIRARVMQPTE